MKGVLLCFGLLLLLAALAVLAHFAVIEIGQEVVTLRTQSPDGRRTQTRLWAVDDGNSVWLHSGGTHWAQRFVGNPVVELERAGKIRSYRAHAVPGPHPHLHALLRAKYGNADRWVRFVGPDNATTVPVRLDPIGPDG